MGRNIRPIADRKRREDRIPGTWSSWLLLAVILLGTGLALYQLDADSLWLDEMFTLRHSQEPSLADLLDSLDAWSGRPLHFFIVHFTSAMRNDEYWLRLPSVAFGVLSIVTTYKIGQVLFGGLEGLLAAFLLALSPYHIRYSQEARTYSLFLWLSLLSLYFFLQAQRSGRWRWWVGFTFASILNTYTHYFSALVLLAEVMAGLILFAVDGIHLRKTSGPDRRRGWRSQRRFIAGMLISLLAITLTFLPSLSHMASFWERQSSATDPAPNVGFTVPFFAGALNTFTVGPMGGTPVISVFAWPFLAFFLLGLLSSWLQHQRRSLLWILVWMFLPIGIMLVIPSKHFFDWRYLIFIIPLFLIAVSRGITGLGAWLGELASTWPAIRFRAPLGLAVVVLAFGALQIMPLSTYYAQEKEDWRSATDYLRGHVQQGDIIICDGYHRGGRDSFRAIWALQHYFEPSFQNNVVARETQIVQAIEPIAQEYRDVWGLVYIGAQPWEPDGQEVHVARFNETAVIHLQETEQTALEQATEILETFLEFSTDPGRFDLHMELGKLYTLQGDPDRAAEHLAQALTVIPKDPRASGALARAYAWFRQRSLDFSGHD